MNEVDMMGMQRHTKDRQGSKFGKMTISVNQSRNVRVIHPVSMCPRGGADSSKSAIIE